MVKPFRRSIFGVINSVCLSAVVSVFMGLPAHAISVSINGEGLPVSPGNGTGVGQNNVLNSGPASVTDAFNTGTLLAKGDASLGTISVTGVAAGSYFGVEWYFAGAESGHQIQLTMNGLNGTFTHTENNENNNCASCGVSPVVPNSLGVVTSQLSTGASNLINFSLKDLNDGDVVNNFTALNNKPNQLNLASLSFSYLTSALATTAVAPADGTEAWFLFALNDGGSPDDNHDDYVGFARVFVFPPGGEIPGVPLPPALVLFGSALVGLTLLGRRRRRAAV